MLGPLSCNECIELHLKKLLAFRLNAKYFHRRHWLMIIRKEFSKDLRLCTIRNAFSRYVNHVFAVTNYLTQSETINNPRKYSDQGIYLKQTSKNHCNRILGNRTVGEEPSFHASTLNYSTPVCSHPLLHTAIQADRVQIENLY